MPSSWNGKDDELTLVASDGADSIRQEQTRGALVRRAPSARRLDAVTRAEAKKELHRLCHELARLSQEVAQDCLSGLATDLWPAELETIHTNIQNLQNRLGLSWCPQPGHDEDEDQDDHLLGDNDDNSRLVLHSSGARLLESAAAEELSSDEFARTAPVISGARSHRRAQGSRRRQVEYSEGSTQPHRGIDNASQGGRRGHSPGEIYTDRPSTRSSRDFLGPQQSTAGWTTSHYTQRVAPRHERDLRHIRDPGSVIPRAVRPGSYVRRAGNWVLDSIDPNAGKVKEDVRVNQETGVERVAPSYHYSTDADGEVSLMVQPGQQDFSGADLSSSGPNHGRHKSNKSHRSHGSDRY